MLSSETKNQLRSRKGPLEIRFRMDASNSTGDPLSQCTTLQALKYHPNFLFLGG